jgi:hypothetical protein
MGIERYCFPPIPQKETEWMGHGTFVKRPAEKCELRARIGVRATPKMGDDGSHEDHIPTRNKQWLQHNESADD